MPKAWTKPDDALVRIAGIIATGRALDVGCGGGHDAIWLAQQGWSVRAIDTSRHAVATVRRLATEKSLNITVAKDDVTALDAMDEFDLVSICYMHLPASARSKMLANASQAVKPGGTLLFRSFDASIGEAPFERSLLPSCNEVLEELGAGVAVQQADVADEFFPYMKKQMRLLTVIVTRIE